MSTVQTYETKKATAVERLKQLKKKAAGVAEKMKLTEELIVTCEKKIAELKAKETAA